MPPHVFDFEKLMICAYFGRRDLFWGGIYANPRTSAAALIKHLKQQPMLDDATRIKNRGWLHEDRMDYIASSPELLEQEKKDREFAKGFLGEEPSDNKSLFRFFSDAQRYYDLSTKSRFWGYIQKQTPDPSLSTAMVYFFTNPKKNLAHTDLSGHTFAEDYRFFEEADFSGTDLRNTSWDVKTTSIAKANFSDADLRGANGMTAEYLATARIDEKTKLPENIKRPAIRRARMTAPKPPAPAP